MLIQRMALVRSPSPLISMFEKSLRHASRTENAAAATCSRLTSTSSNCALSAANGLLCFIASTLVTWIRREFRDANIIVLTTYPGDARVVNAFALGAASYLLKTARSYEIIDAIRRAIVGRQIAVPQAAQDAGHE